MPCSVVTSAVPRAARAPTTSAYDRWVCTTAGRSGVRRARSVATEARSPWSGPNGPRTVAPPRAGGRHGPAGSRTTSRQPGMPGAGDVEGVPATPPRSPTGSAHRAVGRGRSEPLLQPLEGGPEALAVVDVALPDLGDEADAGASSRRAAGPAPPVDLAVADLHALAVDAGGVDEVQVLGVRRRAGRSRRRTTCRRSSRPAWSATRRAQPAVVGRAKSAVSRGSTNRLQ